ncbi:MAG: organomercurial lyase [Candidatus Neomarinimicrobiota bacterium]|nr:organomercurial lyase [Candidatus Neomarinimicrobiota bacterium]
MLSQTDRKIRFFIYRHFIDTAEAPTSTIIAEQMKITETEVGVSLRHLESKHALALKPDSLNIWMAHPFSAIPTPFPVKTSDHIYYANCAWDALGIPALLGVNSETETTCLDCGTTMTFGVQGGQLSGSNGVIHFSVPPRNFWDDVGFT